jgi:5'(3')-deoxyribonucleotidase
MNKKFIIALDVDDLIADLVSHWLDLYNMEYDDNLRINEITDWDITKFVLPECGSKIYNFLNYPGLYSGVLPIPVAIEGVQVLKRTPNVRVIFVTAQDFTGGKLPWLRRYGLLEDNERSDFIVCKDKYLIRADILVDDNIDNFMSFPGKSILFTRPWNRYFSEYEGEQDRSRASDWYELSFQINNWLYFRERESNLNRIYHCE